jgi:ArsR family transcriptional regulator, arsenate/arsenite/antimonite-responsive transcriptional repressor
MRRWNMDDLTKQQAALFGALADPTRLSLLKLLRDQREPDALCVGAMAGLLGVSQPAVSAHLRVLKSAALVTGERRGYHVHYKVNQEAFRPFQSFLGEAVTSGDGDPCKGCHHGTRTHAE